MIITSKGLDAIERAAEKKRSADTLLLVQVLKEVRQVAALLKQQNDARDRSHPKDGGLTDERIKSLADALAKRLGLSERAFVSAAMDLKPAKSDAQERKKLHEEVKAASNKEILRKQLELLAEYPRVPEGKEQIPACSREMVQIYRELAKAEIRPVLLPIALLGVGFSVLYGLGIFLIKFANRK